MKDILETIDKITSNINLISYDLKYCLVDKDKKPFTYQNIMCRPNNLNDFVDLETLLSCDNLNQYAGIGISIQASNICAIDVDKCFLKPFDLSSADVRAKDLLEMFKDCYCEFSFSGTGLRILFSANVIEDYSSIYYIKNEKVKIEYYQPSNSYRYVTLTGQTIKDNSINQNKTISSTIIEFLNKYMVRPKITRKVAENKEYKANITFEQASNLIKYEYFTNLSFQNKWFSTPSGSGGNESETDFAIISYIFDHVTQDKELIKELFESSPYFKKKDYKHIYKWNYGNFRYYNYIYDRILGEVK